MSIFRDHAIPLYRGDEAMLSFRAFREIESPIALDLIVVSTFRGMSGMDRSRVVSVTAERREVIVAPVPELAVR